MVHPVSLLTPVKSNNALTYWPAAYLSLLSGQKRIAVLLDPAQIGANGSKACNSQPLPTSSLITALKVATYIITGFILPALAFLVNFVVRSCYKFHYVAGDMQVPSLPNPITVAMSNEVPGFAAFHAKCLGAEQHIEDLIHGRLRSVVQITPDQIEVALKSYIDTLIQERTALQIQATRLGKAVPSAIDNFLVSKFQEMLLKLVARQSKYMRDKCDKADELSQLEYRKALSSATQQYLKQMEALQNQMKKAQEAAKPEKSAPPAIERTFLTKTYPHAMDSNTFTCLNIFQAPGNKVQVDLISALFGNAFTKTFQHTDIDWRTAPTAENVRNPANWALDGIKVIFREKK